MRGRHIPRVLLVALCVVHVRTGDSNNVITPEFKSMNFQPYPTVDDMPDISASDLENAFAKGEAKVKDRANKENDLQKKGAYIPKNSMSAEARHQRFTASTPFTVKMDENQLLFQGASEALAEQYDLTHEQIAGGLPNVDLPQGSTKAGGAVSKCQNMYAVGSCNSRSYFRTADGSCNNLQNPSWGKSFTCFQRLLPADYSDGVGAPRRSESGGELPNPRGISSAIHNDIDIPARDYTLMTMQWGQFMDHDMTLTPMTKAGQNMSMIECCPLSSPPVHPACFAIPLPTDDNFFAPRGQTCLNFVRSAACENGCNLGQRQQTNQLTAFIDASNVYGSTLNDTTSLRSFSGGQLSNQISRTAGELLPPSIEPENDQCSRQEGLDRCFHAGDERVNEQPGLTSMHTVWLRQHNRLASALADLDNSANDETLFQRARKIVGAQIQAITYGEFLPVVLGQDYMDYFSLNVGDNTQYDPNTNPTIFHEFSTAAYRFGHTLIQNVFQEINERNVQTGTLNLSENFFFPQAIFRGEIPQILRGLSISPAQQYDRHIVEAVTNNLYKQRGTAFGMDLPALNLQRGRDHGLNGYTSYIKFCFQDEIQDFSDLETYMVTENWQKLKNLYNSVNDIELFTGGVSERPLPGGAVVGPTFGCIIGVQFYHLKFGDRFYFEHQGVLSPDQRDQIRNTKLSRVLCYNAGISKIKINPFLPKSTTVPCDYIDDLDIDYFRP